MGNITIELTYDELSTICRALGVLKGWDEEQMERKLYSREAIQNLDMEIETCIELMKSDGKVYQAWKEAQMEA